MLSKDANKMCLLEQVDVLVDGPFIKEKANSELKYRGSTNQHIYALNHGQIIKCLDEDF